MGWEEKTCVDATCRARNVSIPTICSMVSIPHSRTNDYLEINLWITFRGDSPFSAISSWKARNSWEIHEYHCIKLPNRFQLLRFHPVDVSLHIWDRSWSLLCAHNILPMLYRLHGPFSWVLDMRSRKRLLVQIDASSCAFEDCLYQIRARIESFI